MKLIRRFLNISLVGCMLLSTSTGAHAVDYSFSTESASDYYSSTSYEDAYGSQYNYGGLNVVDYQIPELEYGSFSTTLTGVMELDSRRLRQPLPRAADMESELERL